MKKTLPAVICVLCLTVFVQTTFSQNVGIGNLTPAEKLDVTGNINVTGTIKANGVDGTTGQVLMKNNSGMLAWGDMCEFKNYAAFDYTSAGDIQNFSVPAGITKIKVQLWGGGGMGYGIGGSINSGCGGGGGGYIEGYFTVAPAANVNVRVANGAGSGNTSAGQSQVDYNSFLLAAYGGGNATYDAGFQRVTPGAGGSFFASGLNSFMGVGGQPGRPTILRYDQITATDFGRSVAEGNGGDAGNTASTGGTGGYLFVNVTNSQVLSYSLGTNGREPGGGAPSSSIDNRGANGRVIIYY